MIKTGGDDIFADNTFSWFSWSADVLQTPAEIRVALDAFNLTGKCISDIRAIGYGYNLQWDSIEEVIYRYAIGLSDEERSGIAPTDWYDERVPILRGAQVDEPFIITFDGGDRLEILFSGGSCVRVSKNVLPPDIRAGTLPNNFDAAQLFSPCIGEAVIGIEIKKTSKMPMFTGSHGMGIGQDQEEYIEKVRFLLSGGKKLSFMPDFDYGWIVVTDWADKPLTITLGALKQLVTGRWGPYAE